MGVPHPQNLGGGRIFFFGRQGAWAVHLWLSHWRSVLFFVYLDNYHPHTEYEGR